MHADNFSSHRYAQAPNVRRGSLNDILDPDLGDSSRFQRRCAARATWSGKGKEALHQQNEAQHHQYGAQHHRNVAEVTDPVMDDQNVAKKDPNLKKSHALRKIGKLFTGK